MKKFLKQSTDMHYIEIEWPQKKNEAKKVEHVFDDVQNHKIGMRMKVLSGLNDWTTLRLCEANASFQIKKNYTQSQ